MKNEPWIDRVYKEKIESWDIPVDLKHWEQAAALIDAQEKKKKRIIWFWLLGLALLIGGVGFSIKLSRPASTKEVPIIQPIKTVPANEPIAQQEIPTENKSDLTSTLSPSSHEKPTVDASESIFKNQFSNKPSIAKTHTLTALANSSKTKQKVNSSSSSNVELNKNKSLHDYSTIKHTLSATNEEKAESTNLLVSNFQNLDELPNNQKELIYSERTLTTPEIFIPIQVEINRKKWKELGLRLGLAKQTESIRTNAISALGFEIYSQKQLGSKAYWGVSLGYNSFFNSSLYSEVLTSYQFKGFGSVVQNFGIKPEWMHYLYLQANMGFQLKKHRTFVGLKPELLLGALGKVDQLKFKEGSTIRDLNTAEASSIGNGWLEKGALHQLVWNSHIGYEYQFHPKVSIGIQANRQLNSLYRPLPGDFAQSNIAKWNMGMRVSYKIK